MFKSINTSRIFNSIGIILLFYSFLNGCRTIGEDSKAEKKQAEVLEAQLGVVMNFINQGQPEKAHLELRELAAENPKNPDIENLMGLAQLALRNTKRAERHFRNALAIKSSPAYALNLTSALIELGGIKEAEARLTELVKLAKAKEYPYPERVYHNVGRLFEIQKKTKAAERAYRRALEENPMSYMTLMQLARFYRAQARSADVRRELMTARQACGRCYEPVKLLVEDYGRAGDYKAALETLRSYLGYKELAEIDRQNAQEMLAKLEEGSKSKSTAVMKE